MNITINGKTVDLSSLEVDGIDRRDYPDLCDAYFADGCYIDGVSLSDGDLDLMNETEADLLYELAYDNLISMGGH